MNPVGTIVYALSVAASRMNKHALVYALCLIVVFTLTYRFIGLERHFDVPEYVDKRARGSWTNCLYVSALAQSNAMPDYAPKTTMARVLFMLQVVSGWMWVILFTGNVFRD